MKLNILFLLLLVGFASCEKDVDEFTPYNQRIKWPEILDLKTESRSFNAGEDSEVKLGKGEILFIPRNTIVDASGKTLSGKVDLSLTFIRKKSDLIFAYMNSNSPSTPLENHHVVKIKAYQDKHPVKIKDGASVKIQSPTNHQIGQGGTWLGSAITPNNFEWNVSANELEHKSWTLDGVSYSGVEYASTEFGWITGASKVITDHQVCVNFSEGFDQNQIKVFFVFEDQFVVSELKPFSDSQNFCTKVPDGTTGHIIIINQNGNAFNYQKETVTVTQDLNFSGQPVATVLETIVLDLNGL